MADVAAGQGELSLEQLEELIARYSSSKQQEELVMAVLAAGLLPNAAYRTPGATLNKDMPDPFCDGPEEEAGKEKMHSLLQQRNQPPQGSTNWAMIDISPLDGPVQPGRGSVASKEYSSSRWWVYSSRKQSPLSEKTMMEGVSPASDLALLLFAPNLHLALAPQAYWEHHLQHTTDSSSSSSVSSSSWHHADVKVYSWGADKQAEGAVQLLGGFVQYSFPEGTHLDALLQLRRHIQSLLRVTIEGSEVLASAFSSSLAGALGQLLVLSPDARGDWKQRGCFEELLQYHRAKQAEALISLKEEREQEMSSILEDWQFQRAAQGGFWKQQGQRDAFWGSPGGSFLSGTEGDEGGWLDLQQLQGGYLGATPAAAAAAADPKWLPTGSMQLGAPTQGDAAGDGLTPELQETSSSNDSINSSSRVARSTVFPVTPQQLQAAGFAEVQQLLAPLVGKSALEVTALAWEVLPQLQPLLSDGTMLCLLLPAPKGAHLYFKVGSSPHGGRRVPGWAGCVHVFTFANGCVVWLHAGLCSAWCVKVCYAPRHIPPDEYILPPRATNMQVATFGAVVHDL
jgi:hypothetical protein